MNNKKDQFHSEAVIDFNQIPEHVLKSLGLTILEALKNDKEIQKRYKNETGKNIFKNSTIKNFTIKNFTTKKGKNGSNY